MSKADEKINKRSDLVSQNDLAELILAPLASLIDTARRQILGKVQEMSESLEIIAGEMKRQLDSAGSNRGNGQEGDVE